MAKIRVDINKTIITYLAKYNPEKIGIFGSYARGENSDSSDIDILVNFKDNVSLFDLGGMKYDLTQLLNRQVDIVLERSVNDKIRKYIYDDLMIIYA
jgi:predicted nucleotidyltransferase